MTMRWENGVLVHEEYRVDLRMGPGYPARPELQALDGQVFRFRYGFALTNEYGGVFAGEVAMIAVDPAYPLEEKWIPSGDLRQDAAGPDLVEQAK